MKKMIKKLVAVAAAVLTATLPVAMAASLVSHTEIKQWWWTGLDHLAHGRTGV